MTNEEAIAYFKRHLDLYCVDGISREAEEMAIQALSSWEEYSDKLWKEAYERGKTEALSQEPCDDAISRDAVKNAICDYVAFEEYEDESHTFTIRPLTKRIKQLPSVNPQPSEHFIDGVHAVGYREGYKDAEQKSDEQLYKNGFADGYEQGHKDAEQKSGKCKDCKWWKDSDGVYRRGVGAESKCPINNVSVNHGFGYCYMFEPQESEE